MYIVKVKIFGKYDNFLAWNEANDGYYYSPGGKYNIYNVRFLSKRRAKMFMEKFYTEHPKRKYKIVKR